MNTELANTKQSPALKGETELGSWEPPATTSSTGQT